MKTFGLALAALLLAAAPASAADYTVTGTGDAAGSCGQIVNNAADCQTLRAAVSRANQDQTADTILLPANETYTLTQQGAQLVIGTTMGIVGADGRQTMILAAGGTRAFAVNPGANLTLSRLTVSGGTVAQGTGGDILNQGTLTLDHARVTGGTALSGGGGVANVGGTMVAVNSLIDGNTATNGRAQGGGVLNMQGSGTTVIPSQLTLIDTTVAGNTLPGDAIGAGIATVGSAAQTSLTSVTVARNTAGNTSIGAAGLYQNIAGTVQITASIVADNTVGGGTFDCGQNLPTATGQNLSTSACGFSTTANPLLDATPSNRGGQTNVLAIPANSPAKRLVAVCPVSSDQRDAPRQLGGVCDAGAYEQITPPPTPHPPVSPTPMPTPSPTPTPTATPKPKPVFHKNVVVRPVSGTVKVKLPGTNKFVDVDVTQNVPLGSTIDVKHGKISLTSVPKSGGKPQTAKFYGGIFKLTQPGGITLLTLNEPLAVCPRRHASAAAIAAAKKKKPKTRRLWGDGHGAFRTKGRYSAATVRGTKWLVQDSCAGTLTRVVHGVMSVRDRVRHKTVILRAGKRYLARPRR